MNKSWSLFSLRRRSSVWLLSFTFILAHINSERQPRFIKAKPAPASAVQRRLSFKRCTLALLIPLSSISPLGPVVVRRAIYAYIDLLVCVLAPCEGGGFLCGVLDWLQWAHIWPAESDQIGERVPSEKHRNVSHAVTNDECVSTKEEKMVRVSCLLLVAFLSRFFIWMNLIIFVLLCFIFESWGLAFPRGMKVCVMRVERSKVKIQSA